MVSTLYFLAYPRQKVLRLLILELKNYSCIETGQKGQVPFVPPNKLKTGQPKNYLT